MLDTILLIHIPIIILPLVLIALHQHAGWLVLVVSTVIMLRVLSDDFQDYTIPNIILVFLNLGIGVFGSFYWRKTKKLPPIPKLSTSGVTPPPIPITLPKHRFSTITLLGWSLSLTLFAAGIVSANMLNDYTSIDMRFVIPILMLIIGLLFLVLRNANGWLFHLASIIFSAFHLFVTPPPVEQNGDISTHYLIYGILLSVYLIITILGFILWNKRYKQQERLFTLYKTRTN